MYGARAGNGIVMVTTKKGNSDKIRVNYSGSYSLSSPTQPIEFLPNTLVAELQDRAAVYNNGVPTFMKQDANGNLYWPDGVLEQLQNGTFNDVTGNTDWNSLLFHKYAPMQSHSVSLNGGSENTHYFMSARYYHLGGIYKTDISSNDRLNMRMHLDHYFDKIGLRVNGDVSFSQDKTKYPPHGLFTIWTHVARLNSLTRCFNNQGHPTNGQENPYVEIDPAAGYRKGDAQYTNLSLSLDWAVPKVQGLNLGALVHYNLYNDFNKDWYANETGVGPVWDWTDQPYNLGKAHLSEGVYRSNEVTYEFRADYNRTFKEDHTIGATVVFNSWKYNYNEMGASRREYDTNVIEQINGGPSSTAQNFGTAVDHLTRIVNDADNPAVHGNDGRRVEHPADGNHIVVQNVARSRQTADAFAPRADDVAVKVRISQGLASRTDGHAVTHQSACNDPVFRQERVVGQDTPFDLSRDAAVGHDAPHQPATRTDNVPFGQNGSDDLVIVV